MMQLTQILSTPSSWESIWLSPTIARRKAHLIGGAFCGIMFTSDSKGRHYQPYRQLVSCAAHKILVVRTACPPPSVRTVSATPIDSPAKSIFSTTSSKTDRSLISVGFASFGESGGCQTEPRSMAMVVFGQPFGTERASSVSFPMGKSRKESVPNPQDLKPYLRWSAV
jgi:hypothetical protein